MAPSSTSGKSTGAVGVADMQAPQTGTMPDTLRVPEVEDLELRLGRPSLKRKEVESSGNRFKIVSQLVIAMKRFQASLNPTYTYGKRPSPSSSTSAAASSRSMRRTETPTDIPEVSSVSATSQPGRRTGDKAPAKAPRPRTQHGHKFDYLCGALPPTLGELRGRPPAVPKSHSMRSVSTSSSS